MMNIHRDILIQKQTLLTITRQIHTVSYADADVGCLFTQL